MADIVLDTDLSSHFPFVSRGKVREIWNIDERKLLFVATDRISAYDVILGNGVPHKGTSVVSSTRCLFLLNSCSRRFAHTDERLLVSGADEDD